MPRTSTTSILLLSAVLTMAGCRSGERGLPLEAQPFDVAAICLGIGTGQRCQIEIAPSARERAERGATSGGSDGTRRERIRRAEVAAGSVAGRRTLRVRTGSLVVVDDGGDNRAEIRIGVVD